MSTALFRAFAGLLVLASHPATAQDASLTYDTRVQSLQRAALSGSPLDFIDALRMEGIPCGLQISAETWDDIVGGSGLTPDTPSARRQPRGIAKLGDLIEAFRLAHPNWLVELDPKQVVLRQDTVSRRSDGPRTLRLANQPLREAFMHVVNLYVPSYRPSGGCVGSFPGGVRAGDPCETPRVSVDVEGKDLEDLLGQVAATVPGTAWVLIRHQKPGASPLDGLVVRYADGRKDWYPTNIPVVTQ